MKQMVSCHNVLEQARWMKVVAAELYWIAISCLTLICLNMRSLIFTSGTSINKRVDTRFGNYS